MSDVTLSSAVRSNLLSLQNTADLMAKTQERLATGNKVNSALDNPTNFFTASSLNSRAGDLGRLLDSVANATQTLEAADNGISAITKLVESAQASARQALQVKGQQTESVVTGSAGATFNPQALTSVAGDNTGSVPAGLVADAVASIDTQSIAADIANIANITTGDLDTGATDGLGLLSDASPNGPGLTAGESISLTVDGVDYTLNFDASTAAGGARTGSAGAGYALTIGVDQTLGSLTAAFDELLNDGGADASGVTVTGTDSFTFAFASTVDVVEIGDGTLTDTTLQKLNLDDASVTGEIDKTSTAGDTGDYVLARNADIGALIAAQGSTQSIQVQVGSTTPTTINVGTAAGQVSSKADLISQLDAATGVAATGNAAAAGAITVSVEDANDADSTLTFTASAAEINDNLFNFNVAADDGGLDLDTENGLVTTSTATNLLTQAAAVAGEAIEITVGDSTPLRVLFGNGTGEVSTIGELNTRLQSLSNGAASVDARGEINITADNAGDSVSIAGDANALSSFGLSAGETNSLIDGTNIALGDKLNIQVGTNTQLTITFGTGAGQVNTLNELTEALGNLAGGTATIDNTTGAISVTARQGTDNITISGTDAADVDKPTVRSAFGLPSSGTSTTTDSTERANLRSQYNELLTQVDELAEDAGFNGVNLLNGDNLKVIFNEDGSSKLDITGVRFDSGSLGMSRAASGYFQSDSNIETTLSTLDGVIGTLRSQASQFGSNLSVVETRENFTKSMINTLETGAANLTLADTNEEGANLLALQTRQQLSSTALSLASQADQNVLRLF